MDDDDVSVPAPAPAPQPDQVSRRVADLVGDDTSLKWVVDGILPEGSLIMLAGSPKKSRKTLTAMHMGLCVAQGLPFLGKIATSCRRVVYTFLEDGPKRGARRFKQLGVDPVLHQNVAMAATFGPGNYWTMHERISATKEPILWVIDPLAELMTHCKVTDENNATEVTNFLRPLRELCQEKGHTIVLIHHFRKAGDRARGSSSLEAAVDGWWEFKPGRATPGQHHPVIARVTLRDGDDGTFGVKLIVDKATDQLSLTHKVTKGDEDEEDEVEPGYKKKTGGRTSTIEAAGRVTALLVQEPDKHWTLTSISDELGISPKTVKKAIDLRNTQSIENGEPPCIAEPAGTRGFVWTKKIN